MKPGVVIASVLGVLGTVGSCKSGESTETEDGTRYGALMSEVGHRFGLIGRAAQARRWELADFELYELEEGARRPGN